jgi:hypothetical protein
VGGNQEPVEFNRIAAGDTSYTCARSVNLSPKPTEQLRRISWQTRKRLVRIPCVVVRRVMVNTVVLPVRVQATLLRSIATAGIPNAVETFSSPVAIFSHKRRIERLFSFVGVGLGSGAREAWREHKAWGEAKQSPRLTNKQIHQPAIAGHSALRILFVRYLSINEAVSVAASAHFAG